MSTKMTIPDQIRSQSGDVIRIETGQGTAVLSRWDADRVLRGAELRLDAVKGWWVR